MILVWQKASNLIIQKALHRLNEKGKIAFTKHNIRLDIESFTIPVQAVSTGMPTMMGKQMLGDYYLKQLVEVNKATITRYETHIIDGNVMFYLGRSYEES